MNASPNAQGWREALELLRGRAVVALTGAGMSTRSGIPDYRGPGTRRRAKAPVQFKEFTADPEARRRYWARAAVGWPRFSAAKPNAAHRALTTLQDAGALAGLITQNVDRLHHAAGSRDVVELHGALAQVRCLECGELEARSSLQRRLVELNPQLAQWEQTVAMAPDGDAELQPPQIESFVVADCTHCGGRLKPDVVFFGENVPRPVTERAWATFDRAEVLLVAGSSLTVFSGYRFVRRAAKQGTPVVIVNLGPTRGDGDATARIDADVVQALPELVAALT